MIDHLTKELVDWISHLPAISIYAVFFLIAYGENVIPPIPGDILVVFGGYLAAEGLINIWIVFGLTTIASVFGFMSMYYIGRYWGGRISANDHNSWFLHKIGIEYLPRVQKWMNKWGYGVIVANRFLAGTRSVISLTAGMTGTKVSLTIVSSSVSSLFWNAILIGSGWIIRENWRIIGKYLSIYGRIILSALILLILLKIFWKFIRKRVKDSEKPLN